MTRSELQGLGDVANRMRALRSTVNQMRSAWPEGQVFEGVDASGALTVELGSDGRVKRVRLAQDWLKKIDSRALARAVNEATGAASARLGDAWLEEWDQDGTTEDAPPRPSPTLAQYRALVPAPKSLLDLRAKADAAADAREEYAEFKGRVAQAAQRERFDSPRGLFRVTRSRAQLTGLEFEHNDVVFVPVEDVGREVVAALDEIDRRALLDAPQKSHASAAVTALTELRERAGSQ